jgi:hypothetical protein
MAIQTDYDPVDLAGQAEREDQRRQRVLARTLVQRRDLVWLLSGRRGRRTLRRELRAAGFDIAHDEVASVFDRHHGQMAFQEGLRFSALRLLWPIMRLLASGELPFESFRDLMIEEDE